MSAVLKNRLAKINTFGPLVKHSMTEADLVKVDIHMC